MYLNSPNEIRISEEAKKTPYTIIEVNRAFITADCEVLDGIGSEDADSIREYFMMLQSRLIACLDLQLGHSKN